MNPPGIDSVWDYNDPAATEQRFLELLPQAKQDPSHHAELLTQIARTHSLRKQFDQAHQTLDKVEATPGLAPRARVRYLLERGRTFRSSGQLEQAKPLFERAWELGRAEGEHVLATDAAHMLALVERGEASLEWNRTAVAYARQHPDAKQRWLGSLLNNLGWSLSELGRFEAALAAFRQAWDHFKAAGKPWETFVAAWTVGRTLRSLGRFEEALEVQGGLFESEAGQKDGYVHEELAEGLLALGKADEAKPYFATAFTLLSQDQNFARNEAERLARLEQLGR